MGWPTAEPELKDPDVPDEEVLKVWAKKLSPLIKEKSKKEVIVVFSNRCGTEDKAEYAGTSAVLGIKEGKVVAYGILGKINEALLVVDTSQPPAWDLSPCEIQSKIAPIPSAPEQRDQTQHVANAPDSELYEQYGLQPGRPNDRTLGKDVEMDGKDFGGLKTGVKT